jgi:hypothetical protein
MEIRGVDNNYSSFFPINNDEEGVTFAPAFSDKVSPVGTEKKKYGSEAEKTKSEKSNKFYPGNKELTPEEQKRVEELKKIDAKVRAHEMAHIAAGGGLVRGGASYNYEIGPDGKQYAVGGEVKIDMSANPDDPEGTIQKMQQVRRAALAPADPSPQDRSVAQQATNIESQMRAKLMEERSKPQKKIASVYNTYIQNETRNSSNKDIKIDKDVINTPQTQSLKRILDALV